MGLASFLNNIFSSKTNPKSLHGLEGIDYVETVFQALVADNKVPGISVTIVQDGQPLLKKGYGYTNLEKRIPVHPENSIFRIASISKCITGLALGKMVEDGLLDWNDSFYKHVPYYPKKEYDFTLRQLASHTAGIREYRGKEYALNKPYSIKESVEIFKDDPLVFEPGKGYLYNSFDFVLLSLAMQEASGITFGDYVKEKVLKPLGMHSTFTPLELESVHKVKRDISCSEFHTKRVSGFKKAVDVDNNYKLAGGGYLSTSVDISKMGQAILEKRLVSNDTYEQLLTSQIINGQATYYGLGFQASQDMNARPFVGHVGNSVGAYTNFFVYPQEQLVISILINCTDPKVQQELDKAVNKCLPFREEREIS